MAYVPSSFSRILTQRNRRWRSVGNFSPHTLYPATPSGIRFTFTCTPSVTDWTSTLTGLPVPSTRLISVVPEDGSVISRSSVSVRV
ncbi:hypothetical protein EEO57_19235 [Escherichia albertii]|nr:hypothetical protein [Escherichia albertii]